MIHSDFQILKQIDKSTQELRERNTKRAVAMKQAMGKKFLLHPDNSPLKREEKRILK